MADEVLSRMSLTEISGAIAKREVSSKEVVLNTLELLENQGTSLNCVARLFTEDALNDAELADQELTYGNSRGLLHGVPLTHKDMFYRKGKITGCGSKICENYTPSITATALIKLDSSGALDIGRLNMVEFAYGLTGHNEIIGNVHNPLSLEHITGGSSSGPAAAVSGNLCYGSLGSDTGGSIRFPASCCGLVGMKPTYGLVSRYGAMPLSFSLDHIGPITRTVTDCALLTQIISGPDENDPTSLKRQKHNYLEKIESGINGIKIGVPRTHFFDNIDGEVLREMKKSLEVFRVLGAEILEIDLPESFNLSNEMANIITAVEGNSAHKKWLKDRPEDYGRQTWKRLLSGSMIFAHDYLEALKLRKVILKEFLQYVFEKVEILHVPVVPIPVPTIAESDIQANPGFIEFLSNLGHCTRPFDYLGLPAVSVPAGKTDNGLPTGFQLVAPPLDEALLFRVARAYEKEKPWDFQKIFSEKKLNKQFHLK